MLSILTVAVTIGIISSGQASVIIQEETYDKFQNMSEKYSKHFSLMLVETENIINTFSSVIENDFEIENFRDNENYRKEYMSGINKILKDIAAQSSSIQGIYLAVNPELTGKVYESWFIKDSGNNFIYQEPEAFTEFYPENEDMKWYYDPVKENRGIWSQPYTDATINVKMISYTKAIYSGDKLIGVAGIDISFADIEQTIEEMVFYKTGYGILTDSEHRVIVHPEIKEGTNLLTLENENFQNIAESAEENDSDVLLYKYRGQDKIMGFSKLSNNWVFMAVANLEDISTPVIKLRRIISLIVIIVVLIAAAISLLLTKSIAYQLNILHEMTEKIGNGDFNLPPVPESKDEIGRLAASVRGMSRKISESQQKLLELNKNMKDLAFYDALTNLPNRRYGMEVLNTLLKEYSDNSDGFSGIMFIDLDNFKEINDTKGHDVGDRILIHASERMNHQINNFDLLCRIGGDEFLLIFKKVPTLKLIESMADRILHAVSSPVQINSDEISSGCSIGIAVIEERDTDLNMILKCADLALYDVKKSGRNNYKIYKN